MVHPLLAASFDGLSIKELSDISGYLVEKVYRPGEVILNQGTVSGILFFITSGQVIVKIVLPGGMLKAAAKLDAGAFFGEIGFLAHDLIAGTMIADEEVTCLTLHHKVLDAMRVGSPSTAFKFERAIARQSSKKSIEYLHKIRTLLHSVTLVHPLKVGHGHYLPNTAAGFDVIEMKTLNPVFLAKIPFFAGFSPEEMDTLMPFLEAHRYDKGYRFLPNDPQSHGIHVISSGAVMLFLKENEILLKSIAVAGAGEIFFTDFFDQQFSGITQTVTCEPSVIIKLGFSGYTKLHELHPEIFYKISHLLHKRVVNSLYILNREFVRMNCEYHDLLG